MEKILFLIIAVAIHLASADNHPFTAEGPSMEPTIHAKDKMVVSETYYKDHSIQRGDIIVFNATKDKKYVKRVIALPGEQVKIEGDNVYINGKLLDEPYLKAAVNEAVLNGITYNVRNFPEQTVPSGSFFVLGDNRSNSADSRDIGYIKAEHIVGKVTSVNGKLSP